MGRLIVFKQTHPKNAQLPIFLTFSPITTVSKYLQFVNAYLPIIFSEFERVTDLSLVQEAKAARPIEVTELGIVTDTRFSHS